MPRSKIEQSYTCTLPEDIVAYKRVKPTYNFSKEQYRLPEDDPRIETCRSILSVLV
jgi:hypothetical protein